MRPLTENGKWGVKSNKVFELDENGERIPVIDKETGRMRRNFVKMLSYNKIIRF